MNRRWLTILSLAAICLLLVWRASSSRRGSSISAQPASPKLPVATIAAKNDNRTSLIILADTPFERGYGSKGGTQTGDLILLADTLGAARLLVKNHHYIPFADNREFTAFLTGKNSQKVAWIRPENPFINRDGELIDRWGNPVFFHQDSSDSTSLRSAGPDGVIWNDDDIVPEAKNTSR